MGKVHCGICESGLLFWQFVRFLETGQMQEIDILFSTKEDKNLILHFENYFKSISKTPKSS